MERNVDLRAFQLATTCLATPNSSAISARPSNSIDEGHVVTWAYDHEGDFTHCVDQWNELAWLRPIITAGALQFGLVPTKKKIVSVEVYAIYHGRFIEMLLAHFDKKFMEATATALGAPQDLFSSG